MAKKLVSKNQKPSTPTIKRVAKKPWHEVVIPYGNEEKFKGVSIGYDTRANQGGYFVYTHRARSKAYTSIAKIPDSIIKRIEETG